MAVFPSVPDRGGGGVVSQALASFFLEELPKKPGTSHPPRQNSNLLECKNNRLPTRLSLEKNEDFNPSWSLTYPLTSFYKVFKEGGRYSAISSLEYLPSH